MADAIQITKAEYLADPAKYLRLSAGETQVHVTGEDGKVLIIMGIGPISDELLALAEKGDREFETLMADNIHDRVGRLVYDRAHSRKAHCLPPGPEAFTDILRREYGPMTDMHTAADEAAKVWMEKCRGREAEIDDLTEVLEEVLLLAFTCSDPQELVLHCQEVFGKRNEGKPMSMEWFE